MDSGLTFFLTFLLGYRYWNPALHEARFCIHIFSKVLHMISKSPVNTPITRFPFFTAQPVKDLLAAIERSPSKALLIAICGGSCSGKTSLTVTVQTPLIFFTQQEEEEVHPAPDAEP